MNYLRRIRTSLSRPIISPGTLSSSMSKSLLDSQMLCKIQHVMTARDTFSKLESILLSIHPQRALSTPNTPSTDERLPERALLKRLFGGRKTHVEVKRTHEPCAEWVPFITHYMGTDYNVFNSIIGGC